MLWGSTLSNLIRSLQRMGGSRQGILVTLIARVSCTSRTGSRTSSFVVVKIL
jgi:hypothetical protein